MGRRKIEIQPITHERNRSVTFLKRKNGLFKKAYELGVLCSVDVAVIIFEERAGHHLKLYQYCSGDIRDIVERHVRYDGEKDTRTPHDFANNANTKLDDAGDGDDDDGDDDDPDSNSRGGNKKRTDAKLKQEFGNNAKLIPPGGDLGLNVDMNDYPPHRPMTIPQPPIPFHHSTQLPPPSGSSSLPLSTERHTSTGRLLPIDNQLTSQKKPRLAPNVSAGSNPKLTPDDSMYNGYLPSPTSAHPPNNYRQNGQSSHQVNYNYLGVATSTPQQQFLPSSSFDFPSSRGAPISRTGYNQRSSTAYPHHQDAQLHGIYHQLMRPPGQSPNGSNSRSQQSPDLLSAFLDNGDDHRPPPTQPSQFAPLDWPSHASSQQQSQAPPPPHHESGHSGDTNWLDFLSHSVPQPGGQQLHMTLPPANGRGGLSWERDRDVEHYTSSERDGTIDKSTTNGSGLISPSSRKRPRADSIAGDRRPSPITRSKASIGRNSLDVNGDAHGPGVKEE
ncbi:hypothetical protein OG21DRAFT_1464749 [Imleria badia]|nr:hypothetical protein OG21DRAFT_1464749 [Imleria badia]